jgi:hypothetical protein
MLTKWGNILVFVVGEGGGVDASRAGSTGGETGQAGRHRAGGMTGHLGVALSPRGILSSLLSLSLSTIG